MTISSSRVRKLAIAPILVGLGLASSACVSNGSGRVGELTSVSIAPKVVGNHVFAPNGFNPNHKISSIQLNFLVNSGSGHKTISSGVTWNLSDAAHSVYTASFQIPWHACWMAETSPGSGTVTYSDGAKEFFAVTVTDAHYCN